MKPKPLASLNHLTLPCVLILNLLSVLPSEIQNGVLRLSANHGCTGQPGEVAAYSGTVGNEANGHHGDAFAVIDADHALPGMQHPVRSQRGSLLQVRASAAEPRTPPPFGGFVDEEAPGR